MKHLSVKEQLRIEREKNERLQSIITKQESDIDYLAMMADVDLTTDDTEVGIQSTEVNEHEQI